MLEGTALGIDGKTVIVPHVGQHVMEVGFRFPSFIGTVDDPRRALQYAGRFDFVTLVVDDDLKVIGDQLDPVQRFAIAGKYDTVHQKPPERHRDLKGGLRIHWFLPLDMA